MSNEDHESWSELVVAHLLDAADDADEAAYLEHITACGQCREFEAAMSETLAEVAFAVPGHQPPAALRASIIGAVEAESARSVVALPRRPVIDVTDDALARAPVTSTRVRTPWLAAAAAVIVLAAGLVGWRVAASESPSVAARCARAHCATATLSEAGRSVGRVWVLDSTVYVQASGLPATPAGRSYVVWATATGHAPMGVAAVRTTPAAAPTKAGELPQPVALISGFAVSVEPGARVPAAPSHVLAAGALVTA